MAKAIEADEKKIALNALIQHGNFPLQEQLQKQNDELKLAISQVNTSLVK